MDDLIVFWTDILSDCFINEINNYEQNAFEIFKEYKNKDNYDFHMALSSQSNQFRTSIKNKISEYQQNLKQELDKAYKDNKQSSTDSSIDTQENNLVAENVQLKEELKQKNEELEKANCIIEILRLSSLELPFNDSL